MFRYGYILLDQYEGRIVHNGVGVSAPWFDRYEYAYDHVSCEEPIRFSVMVF